MTVKIYDRDFDYTMADVQAAQDKLNTIEPGTSVDRLRTFGRFELPLAGADLTVEQQETFTAWAAEHYPAWLAVFR